MVAFNKKYFLIVLIPVALYFFFYLLFASIIFVQKKNIFNPYKNQTTKYIINSDIFYFAYKNIFVIPTAFIANIPASSLYYSSPNDPKLVKVETAKSGKIIYNYDWGGVIENIVKPLESDTDDLVYEMKMDNGKNIEIRVTPFIKMGVMRVMGSYMDYDEEMEALYRKVVKSSRLRINFLSLEKNPSSISAIDGDSIIGIVVYQ